MNEDFPAFHAAGVRSHSSAFAQPEIFDVGYAEIKQCKSN